MHPIAPAVLNTIKIHYIAPACVLTCDVEHCGQGAQHDEEQHAHRRQEDARLPPPTLASENLRWEVGE